MFNLRSRTDGSGIEQGDCPQSRADADSANQGDDFCELEDDLLGGFLDKIG